MSDSIAIVGLSCVYPDARNPFELWENALAQRRAFRRLPSERLRIEDYVDADPSAPDRTYSSEAAVIEGYEFDRVAYRVVGSTYRSADLAHWLALDTAARALADAGFPDGAGLDRLTAGVVLGNTLTGEFSRANLMRLRWPYVRRQVDAALLEKGWTGEERGGFLERLEERYKAPFPPVGEETLAGGLSNTIAGRICNQFDLKGGGFTVDGACASSLLAVANACSALVAGDLDTALAGGVDLSLDPFELVGFAKTGALAPERMRVYDAGSGGFWPGEGSGFVVLMRHEDAVAQGRRIYALIRGWGISSDGAGGITRPEVDGQIQALRRAYRRAGYGIDTVAYFEGHGTGTSVGDTTELQVIGRARREAGAKAPPAVIGSIKANIGHTKAAAGVAGLLKATLAVHTQVLPPTTGCERPHPELGGPIPALRVLSEAEPWPESLPLRAGVSAMGFGGMNAHVTLEGTAGLRRRRLSPRESRLAASAQDCELFLLGAGGPDDLAQLVEQVLSYAPRLSRSELADLAAELARRTDPAVRRAAIVASTPAELAAGLARLQSWLGQGLTSKLDVEAGVFLGDRAARPRLGFLFPGQGAPGNLDGGIYRRRFEVVRELYDQSTFSVDSDVVSTAVAQPAVVTASLAGLRVLRRLGADAAIGLGHSLGEIAALHWAGAFGEEALLRIAGARGRAMADLGGPTGSMAAIAASADLVGGLIGGPTPAIVGFNSLRQTVVAGEALAVDALVRRAQARGWQATRLPVSHAFHTSLVAAAAPVLAGHLSGETIGALQREVVSTVTGAPLTAGEDLRELLCRQVTSPVRFIEAIQQAAVDVDLFIEVGPGQILTGLAADLIPGPVVALDAGGPSLRGLWQAVGAAFVLGAPVDREALFGDRFTRPFRLDWQPRFFASPCEQAPVPTVETLHRPAVAPAPAAAEVAAVPAESTPLELIRRLVAARSELPVSAVRDDSRLLGDLHLNSITVGQLVAEAVRTLGLPPLVGLTDFAKATVGRVAEALEELARKGHAGDDRVSPRTPAGVDSWVRPFVIEWIERPLRLSPRLAGPAGRAGQWRVIAPADHPLAAAVAGRVASIAGAGVVVLLPTPFGADRVNLLLEGARSVPMGRPGSKFILVQHGRGARGFAQTLHLESPDVTTCVIDLPWDHPQAADWIGQEVQAAEGFVEVHYDAQGVRREPRLALLALAGAGGELPLGPDDVLLVTGGGKGIAAECALALGRQSGARLILLGRSNPAGDAELAANLERMAAAGLRCHYCAADVTDAEAVRRALGEAERVAGRITGFLHAAGANVPRLIGALDEAAFARTWAPKIDGVRHVLAALRPGQLRLFVTFGSIIGRAGLAGEADYAVANEWLTELTEEYQAAHPECRCLAAEWSVWSGVGMGQRLGRIEALRQEGITPIPPEEGVAILEQLLRHRLPAVAVVITGRFGELPTLRLEKPELPFRRFLEQPQAYYPGVELIVDTVLSSDTDPYVEEHVYHGERLFPAVMGLEAMAQAAMALAGSAEPPSFEAAELNRPVVVPRGGRVTIRVAALQVRPGEIAVTLRSDESGFQVDHFRVRCRFARPAERLLGTEPFPGIDLVGVTSRPIALDPTQDLYEDLLFHTGRFRRVVNYRQLRARECVAQLEPDADVAWFGRYLPAECVLGDAGVRDAAIHTIQACIPHARLLPIGVERILIGKLPCLGDRIRASGSKPELLLHAREIMRDGDTFVYDLELFGKDGAILEKWSGLRLRKVEDLPRRSPWKEALLGPYLERRLEELIPGCRVGVVVARGGPDGPSARSQAAVGVLLGTSTTVLHRADGKPEVAGGPEISTAHAGDVTLAVGGPAPIGCDLETVSLRTAEAWLELLGAERMSLAQRISAETGDDLSTSATRLWTALECLKKAGAMSDAPLVLRGGSPDGWVTFSSGPRTIATCGVTLTADPGRVMVAVLAGGGQRS